MIGQALKLPIVVSDTLTNKANIYLSIGRVEEARMLFDGAVDVARRHDLPDQERRGQSNRADQAILWDLPDAARRAESALSAGRGSRNRWEKASAPAI